MIPTLVIVFRETLEAALIVSVVAAASRGIPLRTRWIAGGVIAGLFGAGLIALGADVISGLFDGAGSSIFNAAVLLVAVVMLGWHHIWMGTHGKELAAQSKSVGAEVRTGAKPLSALAIVTAVAVLREGSETVLFLYGIAASGTSDTMAMLGGGLLGALGATVLGFGLYAGLLRVPLRHVFRITGILLVLLAAGLAAQAAAFLTQSGLLPPLGYDIWNTSAILPQTNPLGLILHVLVGYVARPLGIQIVFYAATIIVILAAAGLVRRSHTAA